MKIQCDVCGVEAASILCCADEAALCRGCDDRVHSANKLASKHRRVSLLHPSSKTLPLCDICKESRGIVFCQDDRAVLCRDCDMRIHSANTNTSKHIRFLLSGIRLSSAPILSASSSSDVANSRASVEDTLCSSHSGGSTISEYLMNMLPGWRVDDFLFDDAATSENLTDSYLISEPAVETETAGSSSGARAWPGCWEESFAAAAQAPAMAQERLYPMLDSMERGRSGWKNEVSMVPQIQYQRTSKKRSMGSFWY